MTPALVVMRDCPDTAAEALLPDRLHAITAAQQGERAGCILVTAPHPNSCPTLRCTAHVKRGPRNWEAAALGLARELTGRATLGTGPRAGLAGAPGAPRFLGLVPPAASLGTLFETTCGQATGERVRGVQWPSGGRHGPQLHGWRPWFRMVQASPHTRWGGC